MANIALRKEPEARVATPAQTWDPFREMRSLLNWEPFRDLRAFPNYTLPAFNMPEALNFMPAFEVKETKDAYIFKADLPGVKETDLEVTVAGDRLTIAGKREVEKQDKGDTYYTYERSYGSFSRLFTLPQGADADHAKAELKDGVLNLVVPKKAEVQARKIQVKADEKAKA